MQGAVLKLFNTIIQSDSFLTSGAKSSFPAFTGVGTNQMLVNTVASVTAVWVNDSVVS